MKNLYYLILLLLVTSCKEKVTFEGGISNNVGMEVSFVDTNGEDLLNQDNPNAFSKHDIFLYHQINGKKTLYSTGPMMDAPNGIAFYCERPLCAIKIHKLADTTYLELNDFVTDTIYSETLKKGTRSYTSKIWYNGKFLWDIENGGEKYFTIVK